MLCIYTQKRMNVVDYRDNLFIFFLCYIPTYFRWALYMRSCEMEIENLCEAVLLLLVSRLSLAPALAQSKWNRILCKFFHLLSSSYAQEIKHKIQKLCDILTIFLSFISSTRREFRFIKTSL